MHPTRSADIICGGEKIGVVGQIHPSVAEEFNLDKPVYVIELNYDKMSQLFNDKIVFRPISKFPPVERDLAVSVGEDVSCAEVMGAIKKAAGDNLESVYLFDVYQGDQIEKGKKSLAFNLIYQSRERTLNVEEVDESIKNILKLLKEQLNAELR